MAHLCMALASPRRKLGLEQASSAKPKLSYPSPGPHAEWTFLPLLFHHFPDHLSLPTQGQGRDAENGLLLPGLF